MKLGTRIFLCFLVIFAVSFYYPFNWVMDTLRIRYLEGVEEPLVDQANILAALIERDFKNQRFNPGELHQIFDRVYRRNPAAKIYKLDKTRVDMRVYVTDARGIVLFDSEHPENEGADFSRWRDVRLTLDGRYGARATRKYKDVSNSTVLYVAAPILVDDVIEGVVTVGKPTSNINQFLRSAKPQILQTGLISLFAAAFFSFPAAMWLTRPIKRLTRYANDISKGRRPPFPRLDAGEIGEMGRAFERMREALEGKNYVEQYVQTLTHEIKSPISAIRGAAELLRENMPPEQRKRFIANIRTETERIGAVVDRMLELSMIESRKAVDKKQSFLVAPILESLVESANPDAVRKNLRIQVQMEDDITLHGDSFLIKQAVSNLFWNAVAFSPEGGCIQISAEKSGDREFRFQIDDNGPGIPDYAVDKIFEKFFSLQRPDTGRKSTGLGLNFVKEAAVLHGGDVSLENRDSGGVRAVLTLPGL